MSKIKEKMLACQEGMKSMVCSMFNVPEQQEVLPPDYQAYLDEHDPDWWKEQDEAFKDTDDPVF